MAKNRLYFYFVGQILLSFLVNPNNFLTLVIAVLPSEVDYLVIAGGGGGASDGTLDVGGGGGAGGFLSGSNYAIESGRSYAIVVGEGGSKLTKA